MAMMQAVRNGLRVVREPSELQTTVAGWHKGGHSIGFVPTMGALHAGHLSLIRRARRENKRVIVSIFVNPLQFGPNEDFARYPRSFMEDRRLCEQAFADIIFNPSAEQLYPPGFSTQIEPGPLGDLLEGASRPGHFKGVATVVVKLLELASPTRVYFGEKDFQQLQVVSRVSRDLSLPVEIVPCQTVREKDGLALSSRNRYLTDAQRAVAPGLHRALVQGREWAQDRGAKPAVVSRRMHKLLSEIPGAKLDYLKIVDPETLQDAESFKQPTRAVLAAWFGRTRLIDNLALS